MNELIRRIVCRGGFVVFCTSLILLKCASTVPVRGISSFEYRIPTVINLSESDFSRHFSEIPLRGSGYKGVVVPYSYSPFVEVMKYSEDGIVSEKKPGHLKVLIRVMDGDQVIGLIWVESEGTGADNLLRSLAEKIRPMLSAGD